LEICRWRVRDSYKAEQKSYKVAEDCRKLDPCWELARKGGKGGMQKLDKKRSRRKRQRLIKKRRKLQAVL